MVRLAVGLQHLANLSLADRFGKVTVHPRLQVAFSVEAKAWAVMATMGMFPPFSDGQLRMIFGCLDSVHFRHLDIHKYEVKAIFAQSFDGFRKPFKARAALCPKDSMNLMAMVLLTILSSATSTFRAPGSRCCQGEHERGVASSVRCTVGASRSGRSM